VFRRFALGFPLFFLDNFLAQVAFGSEGAAVDYAKGFFLFVVGHSAFLFKLYRQQFITGWPGESLRGTLLESALFVKGSAAP